MESVERVAMTSLSSPHDATWPSTSHPSYEPGSTQPDDGAAISLASARLQMVTRLITSIEAERFDLAHALHNEAIQELAALRFQLIEQRRRASRVCTQDEAASAALDAGLRNCEEQVSAVVDLLRQHINDLRPAGLVEFGLVAALDGFLAGVRQERPTGTPRILFDDRGDVAGLPVDIALTLFRAAQEAVRNSLTHANPTTIQLCIERERDAVKLVIEDDGVGFNPPPAVADWLMKGQYGLFTLIERARGLGGDVRIDSAPNAGTRVTLQFDFPSGHPLDG